MNTENNLHNNEHSHGSLKGKLVWSLVFIAIAALTVFAVTSQEGFTFKGFFEYLGTLHFGWLTAAFGAMLAFIIFEMLAIKVIIKDFGFNRPLHKCFIYSTSDIYFSAITPSSTGGQPASAYFMMKDGISGALSTVALVINLILYSFAIIIIGIVAFIMKPSLFLSLSGVCQILVIVGSICIVSLAALLILVIYKGEILHKIGDAGLVLLAKLHLIKKLNKKRAKLTKAIRSYNGYCDHMRGRAPMIIKALICNVIQRASLISVTLFTYLASGGDPAFCVDIWVIQCLVVIGTNILPIPGAMGISDYMLISSFTSVAALGFTDEMATHLNLVSRGISFYSCVIICGISLIIKIFGGMLIEKKKNKTEVLK